MTAEVLDSSVLPSGWSIKPLRELAVIERVGVRPQDIRTGTLFVGLEHIESGGQLLGVTPVDSGDIASTKFRFNEMHVLYGKLRPYLAKIALPDFAGVCSTDILPIRPGPDLDRNYLAHFLKQPAMVSYAASRATGANLPRLSPTALGEFPIPLPSLGEQRRIAGILDAADRLRAKRREAIALLDTLTQSIFMDMFGDPSRLELVLLSDVAEVQGGLTVNSRRSSLPVRAPYLRVANVDRGAIDLTEVKEIGVSERELQALTLKQDDLLLVEGHGNRNEVGRVARWVEATGTCVHQNHLIRIRLQDQRVHPVFLEHYLNGPGGKTQIAAVAKTTSGLNTVSISQVRALRIPMPELSEQRDFGVLTSAIAGQRAADLQSQAQFKGLFASLQARAFRGEL